MRNLTRKTLTKKWKGPIDNRQPCVDECHDMESEYQSCIMGTDSGGACSCIDVPYGYSYWNGSAWESVNSLSTMCSWNGQTPGQCFANCMGIGGAGAGYGQGAGRSAGTNRRAGGIVNKKQRGGVLARYNTDTIQEGFLPMRTKPTTYPNSYNRGGSIKLNKKRGKRIIKQRRTRRR